MRRDDADDADTHDSDTAESDTDESGSPNEPEGSARPTRSGSTPTTRRSAVLALASATLGTGCLRLDASDATATDTRSPSDSRTGTPTASEVPEPTDTPTETETDTATQSPTPEPIQPAPADWDRVVPVTTRPQYGDGHVVYLTDRQDADDQSVETGVRCHSASDGSQQWTYTLPEYPSLGDAVVTDDAVYFSCSERTAKLDLASGRVRWEIDLGSRGPLTLADGVLVATKVESLKGTDVFAGLDTASGEELWRTSTGVYVGGYGVVEPAVADGVVAVTGSDGGVTAVSASDGGVRWSRDVGETGTSDVAADGGQFFVTAGGAPVTAHDPQSGTENWSLDTSATGDTGGSDEPQLAATGGRVIVSLDHLSAIDAADGTPQWATTEISHTTGVETDGEFLYCVGDTDFDDDHQNVECAFRLDPATGRVETTYPAPFRPEYGPADLAVGDARVFLRLYGYDGPSNRLRAIPKSV